MQLNKAVNKIHETISVGQHIAERFKKIYTLRDYRELKFMGTMFDKFKVI